MELIHLKSETRLINNFAKNFAWILRIQKILGRQIFTDLKNKKKIFSQKFTSLGIYSVYVQQRFLYKQYFWKKFVRIRLVNTFLTLQVFWIHFTCDLNAQNFSLSNCSMSGRSEWKVGWATLSLKVGEICRNP